MNGKNGDDGGNAASNVDEDELETILAEFFDEQADGNTSLANKNNTSFAQKLKALELREKIPILGTPRPGTSNSGEKYECFDLLKFWEGQKFTNPELHKAAMVVLSASSTRFINTKMPKKNC